MCEWVGGRECGQLEERRRGRDKGSGVVSLVCKSERVREEVR